MRADEGAAERVAYGIVVDERRFPQAGARVSVRWGDRTASGDADGSGRFAIRIPVPTGERLVNALVEAVVGTSPDELVATASVTPALAARADVGSMLVVQRPVTETFTLTVEGKPAAGARVRLLAGSKYSPVAVRDLEADAEGRLAVRLAPGSYAWAVLGPEYAEQGWDATLPLATSLPYDPRTIELSRPRTVLVRVVDETGAPVAACHAGFHSGLWGEPAAPVVSELTDARGEIVLPRVPRYPVTIGAWCADPPAQGEARVEAGTSLIEVRLVSRARYTARWPIVSSPDRPPNATPIVFRYQEYRRQPPMPGRVDDDHVIVDGLGDPSEYGYAVDREQRAALLRYSLEGTPSRHVSAPATFREAKRSVLRLVDERGAPIAGQPISMEGWFLLRDAEGRLTRTTCWGEATDSEGQVVFDGAFWEPARLKLQPGPVIAAERELGLFDPDGVPDRVVVVRIQRPRTLEIHVTLDGVPGLRSNLSVHAGGTAVGYEADPTAGILRVPVSIDPITTSLSVAVSSPGFEHWSESIDLTKPLPTALFADLRHEATIALDVTLNAAEVRGEDVEIHRFDVAEGRWVYAGDAGVVMAGICRRSDLERDGILCWHAFAAAMGRRYRIVHVPSGSTTPPFDVMPGETVHQVTLAIESTRRVKGNLLAGPDLALEHVVLQRDHAVAGLCWWLGPEETTSAGAVDANGAFEIVVPAGRESRITIRHPLLRATTFVVPVTLQGPLEVPVAPREILTIPFVSVGSPVAARIARSLDWMSCVRFSTDFYDHESRQAALEGPPVAFVRKRDGDDPGAWIHMESVRLGGPDRLRLGLDVPGRYDVFIDAPAHAPVLLSGIEVAEGEAAHEPVRLSEGVRVRVAVLGSPRNQIQKIRVRATPVDPAPFPPYVRYVEAEDGSTAVVTGLVPGRWTVAVTVDRRLGPAQGEPASFEQTIEIVAGKPPPELTIDVRPPSERRAADDAAGTAKPPGGR